MLLIGTETPPGTSKARKLDLKNGISALKSRPLAGRLSVSRLPAGRSSASKLSVGRSSISRLSAGRLLINRSPADKPVNHQPVDCRPVDYQPVDLEKTCFLTRWVTGKLGIRIEVDGR